MKKRLISFCTAIALIGSLWIATPVRYAAADAVRESEGLVFTKALGFMDDSAKGDETLTRAGLAQVIARLTGYIEPEVADPLKYQHREGSVAQYDYQRISGRPIFKDVPQSHWAVGYIEHAALNGYMRGTQEDKYLFAPDDAAVLTDAYEVMLKLLGYQPLLQYDGGGTSAVLKYAKEAGITVRSNEKLTTGILAEILFQTMPAKVLEQTGINASSGDADYKKNRPYMEYAFDMKSAKRVRVEANDLTDLNGGAECDWGRARIDGTEYTDPTHLAREYIGYVCDIYYIQQDESDTPELRVVLPRDAEETVVDATNAVEITRTKFSYDNNGKTRSKKLSPVVDIIYNHQLLEKWEPSELYISDGTYRLIDTDRDGSVDVIRIQAYQYLIVQDVLKEQKKVQGAYQYGADPLGLDSIILEEEADKIEQRVWYTSKGKPAEFSDIKAGVVLAILRGKGKRLKAVEVEILYNSVSGTADSFTEKGFSYASNRQQLDVVQLGTQKLKVAPALYAAGGKINAGDTGTFYLTKGGLVLAFEKSNASDVKYGFLKTIAVTQIFDFAFKFRILTAEGEWIQLEADKKLKVNGTTGNTGEQLIKNNILSLSGTSVTHMNPQIIRYRSDMSKLLELETVQTDLTAIEDIDAREKALHSAAVNGEFRLCHSGSMRFYGSQQNLDWKVILTKPCPAFLVPDDAWKADEDSFAVRDNNFFEYNTPYSVWSYDENIFGQPGALLVSAGSGAGGAAPSKYMFISDGIGHALNEEGEIICNVSGYYRANAAEYPINDNLVSQKGEATILQDFRPGNALKIALSPKNEIENYELLYDYRAQGEHLMVSDYTGSTNYVYGNVMNVDISSKFVRVRGSVENDGLDSVRNFWVSVNNPFVAIYDGRTERVQQGSFADLEPGDYVVIRMEDIKPSVFFIYRNVF